MRKGGPRFALLLAGACACGVIAAFGATGDRSGGPSYTITDLGTLGGSTSVALGINNNGQVVGGADLPDGTRHPVRWENGGMTDLGTPPPFVQCEAWDINNHGVICGYCCCGAGFVWENGVFTKLPHLTGGQSGDTSAYAINDAGQVVGASLAPGGGGAKHGFLWENNTMTDLGTLGGAQSIAWDINASGMVIGSASLPPGTGTHAFRWETGTMTDLGTLGGDNSDALDTNDNGQIVGWAQDQPGGKFYQAFVWEAGTMTNVGALGGFITSRAEAINNAGLVVGAGFIYSSAMGIKNFDDLIPPGSGWSELSPRDINDSGQIVGAGTINGRGHAFMMTPMTPAPIPVASVWGLAALTLTILAVGTALARRRGLNSQ